MRLVGGIWSLLLNKLVDCIELLKDAMFAVHDYPEQAVVASSASRFAVGNLFTACNITCELRLH